MKPDGDVGSTSGRHGPKPTANVVTVTYDILCSVTVRWEWHRPGVPFAVPDGEEKLSPTLLGSSGGSTHQTDTRQTGSGETGERLLPCTPPVDGPRNTGMGPEPLSKRARPPP